jgi:sarcosine oxidase subunit alpha
MRINQPISDLPPLQRGEPLTVQLDGQAVTAYRGETVAAVLLAEGQRIFRRTPKSGRPRGLFCGIGLCFDCLVTVNGVANVRACLTPVSEGMRIDTLAKPDGIYD